MPVKHRPSKKAGFFICPWVKNEPSVGPQQSQIGGIKSSLFLANWHFQRCVPGGTLPICDALLFLATLTPHNFRVCAPLKSPSKIFQNMPNFNKKTYFLSFHVTFSPNVNILEKGFFGAVPEKDKKFK